MKDALPTPVSVQVAGGFVAPSDRGYASEVVDALCRPSGSARGRVVLFAHRYADGSIAASADAIIVLDEYRLLCAGAIATTMREAIEELETRLRRQLGDLRAHERALTHANRRAVGTVRRSHQRPRAPVSSDHAAADEEPRPRPVVGDDRLAILSSTELGEPPGPVS